MRKPRDFWISFTGNPLLDREPVQQRIIYLKPLMPLPGEDIVHVREVVSEPTEIEAIEGNKK